MKNYLQCYKDAKKRVNTQQSQKLRISIEQIEGVSQSDLMFIFVLTKDGYKLNYVYDFLRNKTILEKTF